MIDFEINFSWYRYSKGYRLECLSPETRQEHCSIVSNGGERIPLGSIEKRDTLYLEFADVKTPDGLLDFVQRYGMLTEGNLGTDQFTVDRSGNLTNGREIRPEGDSVSWCLTSARLFSDLLRVKQQGPRKLADFYLSHADHFSLEGTGEVELVPDRARGVRFRNTTDSLFVALLWQLGRALSGDVEGRECRHCGKWFATGPGKRRLGAEFCCQEHKIKYFSLERSRHNSK